jgi:GDPmannose 4,6-dehydratase
MPEALLIGCKGQDGSYLSQLLSENGYSVTGIGRSFDVTNTTEVRRLVAHTQPAEIYYLAAFHHSSEDPPVDDNELIATSLAVNTIGLNAVLGAVVSESPASRLFYAGSSRMFGDPATSIQNEDTPYRPACAYGISKTAGAEICSYYRRARHVFATTGILYNHESPLRPPKFISRKIVRAAVSIARGSRQKLVVGNLDSRVDWGYAPDYTRAMWRILQLEQPSDFVIGTGILHSVRDFLQIAFAELKLDWQEHVTQNASSLTLKSPNATLCADSSKLRARTGWRPEVDFHQMVRLMLAAEQHSQSQP